MLLGSSEVKDVELLYQGTFPYCHEYSQIDTFKNQVYSLNVSIIYSL